MAATDSTPYAVRGQAFNFDAAFIDASTGLHFAGTLTDLDAQVSLDDAAFVSATNNPVQKGTTEVVYLNLTAAELTASKVTVRLLCSNANVQCAPVQINPLDLTPETERYDAEGVNRFERLALNVFSFLFNRNTKAGAEQKVYNSAGTSFGTGTVQQDTYSADRGKIE